MSSVRAGDPPMEPSIVGEVGAKFIELAETSTLVSVAMVAEASQYDETQVASAMATLLTMGAVTEEAPGEFRLIPDEASPAEPHDDVVDLDIVDYSDDYIPRTTASQERAGGQADRDARAELPASMLAAIGPEAIGEMIASAIDSLPLGGTFTLVVRA